MEIFGLQKMTLLDFPGKVASTLFTYGCNFRCPFCHNKTLVIDQKPQAYSYDEIMNHLKTRKGFLDGVAITGGEPLLHKEIKGLIQDIKDIGLLVKLDTNGSFPDMLKDLVNSKLVDYVAMDIKNSKDKYSYTCGTDVDIDKIDESVKFLLQSNIDFEFRTTMVKNHHDEDSMRKISDWIYGTKRYFLQNFVDNGNLIGSAQGFCNDEMHNLLKIVQEKIPSAQVRGIE